MTKIGLKMALKLLPRRWGKITPKTKSTKINFLGRKLPGGMGILQAKGWGSESSFLPSKVCSGPLGVFKKLVQKNGLCSCFVPYRGEREHHRPQKRYDQWHFYANKAKTKVCHFFLKLYKTRCAPVKRDRKLPAQKVQGMVSIQNNIRTRSERDTNLHNLRAWRDKTGQHSRRH